mmetsp:Transcript_26111/g.65819  ORF Transcript_26111/g.65819 Transcript_26111/m.65819 type:complete len:205 (-) Transcript_26111:867-1481(-)
MLYALKMVLPLTFKFNALFVKLVWWSRLRLFSRKFLQSQTSTSQTSRPDPRLCYHWLQQPSPGLSVPVLFRAHRSQQVLFCVCMHAHDLQVFGEVDRAAPVAVHRIQHVAHQHVDRRVLARVGEQVQQDLAEPVAVQSLLGLQIADLHGVPHEVLLEPEHLHVAEPGEALVVLLRELPRDRAGLPALPLGHPLVLQNRLRGGNF